MKLLTFKNGFRDTIAHRISRGGKSHFNLRHGTRLTDGWEVSMGVDDKIVDKELDDKDYEVILNGDNYILLPIYSKGTRKTITDARGNKKFFISKDHVADKNQILLFLHLPKMKNTSFELYGGASTISLGSEVVYSAGRDDEIIDAPVILLDGDSVITITYVRGDEQIIDRIIFKNGSIQHKEHG